jgi:acyl dehydratase
MAINHEHLLNFDIPEVRQTITKRDAIFYALSVGLGQDPMDHRQLDYVDHHRALKVVPSMAVVLGHPGFWLANPATGVDAVQLVHGEQEIEIIGSLPVEGLIKAHTRVTGLVDKGAGRGALLYSEKVVTNAVSGAQIAITRSTTFLRGDGGFGGPTGPVKAAYTMPDTAPDIVIERVTRPEQALVYRLNGDDNPLHSDPAVAAKAGFPRPILHGLCTAGIVTHALLEGLCNYDADRMKGWSLRFTSPVFPGETIITEIWRNGSFRARVKERDVIAINNGRATITSAK